MSAAPTTLADRSAKLALRAVALLLSIFIIMPLVVIVLGSFSSKLYLTFPPTDMGLRWYNDVAEDPRWFDAARNSFIVGIPVALLAVILGTISALAVVRGRAIWLGAIALLFLAPMMLPHVIIAIGLYPTVLSFGLSNTFSAVIIGHTIVATPIVFITVMSSLRGYSETIEMAARTLGANEVQVFLRVTFPMIRSGVAVGAIFAFATSFDELMLSLFLTGPRTETLPRLIWEHLFYTLTPSVAAVATIILCVSITLLLIAVLLGKDITDNGNKDRSNT